MKPAQPHSSPPAAAKALEARVWQLLGSNDRRQALKSCAALNQRFPDYASGWHTASQLALKFNNPPMALAAIEKALAIEPESTAWLLQKGLCLAQLGQMDQLLPLLRKLATRDMADAYQCSALAMLMTQAGQREEALQLYQRAAAHKPGEAKHYYNMACLQRSLGDIEAAQRNFDKTIELNPADFEACKIRSELRRQKHDNNHVAELEKMLADGIDDSRGRIQICFALAKELEDLGEPERSFQYLKTGADLRRRSMRYDVARDLDTIDAIQRVYDAERLATPSAGTDNGEAIFVLGMPRTGTTLVERVLASHSEVFAAGELNNFAIEMMKLVKASGLPANADRHALVQASARLDFRQLGNAYIESTRPFTGRTPRFIDKMPLNYLYIGLIHRALPNTKVIALRRHPLDTCYAIYKQLFVDAYPFSYDLQELGRYFVAYHRLMEHWNTVLPGVVCTVDYENVVDNFEVEARRLLTFCELEWQPQCLEFYKDKTASTTASTVQVRQPVYRSSVGKWRAFEVQLAPLIQVLEDAGIALDD